MQIDGQADGLMSGQTHKSTGEDTDTQRAMQRRESRRACGQTREPHTHVCRYIQGYVHTHTDTLLSPLLKHACRCACMRLYLGDGTTDRPTCLPAYLSVPLAPCFAYMHRHARALRRIPFMMSVMHYILRQRHTRSHVSSFRPICYVSASSSSLFDSFAVSEPLHRHQYPAPSPIGLTSCVSRGVR